MIVFLGVALFLIAGRRPSVHSTREEDREEFDSYLPMVGICEIEESVELSLEIHRSFSDRVVYSKIDFDQSVTLASFIESSTLLRGITPELLTPEHQLLPPEQYRSALRDSGVKHVTYCWGEGPDWFEPVIRSNGRMYIIEKEDSLIVVIADDEKNDIYLFMLL